MLLWSPPGYIKRRQFEEFGPHEKDPDCHLAQAYLYLDKETEALEFWLNSREFVLSPSPLA